MLNHVRTTLTLADKQDRQSIYRLRHRVYARELRQHHENAEGLLSDALDGINTYIVAKRAGEIVGFVAITPPTPHGYSIDKYFSRADLPFSFDDGLYEVRLLTVIDAHRRSRLAALLMYAALRYADSHGARVIAGIGRREILGFYSRAGLRPHGMQATSGAVTYELMSANVADLRGHVANFAGLIRSFGRSVDWRIDGVPPVGGGTCEHGGAFWHALGASFETLERRDEVISADVLDAWFDPAPQVVEALERSLAFALKTSPPTAGDGIRRTIARARGVREQSILVGGGSSDLMFGVLRGWIGPRSRVLVLDPMYGEYVHLLERVIGARVDRLVLLRENGYAVPIDQLVARAAHAYDWVMMVNPNSPTGRHIPRHVLQRVLAAAPATTRFWIDETYVDYVDEAQSLETFAAASANVIVCKSMSKAYALSGVRVAYLCGPETLVNEAQRWSPPWSVSLPGQIAGCAALGAVDYYRSRWRETAVLREQLREGLAALGWDVIPGCANFLLCHLPPTGPTAAALASALGEKGLFLRDAGSLGSSLGARAVRVAVKDAATNARMLAMLREALGVRSAEPKGAAASAALRIGR